MRRFLTRLPFYDLIKQLQGGRNLRRISGASRKQQIHNHQLYCFRTKHTPSIVCGLGNPNISLQNSRVQQVLQQPTYLRRRVVNYKDSHDCPASSLLLPLDVTAQSSTRRTMNCSKRAPYNSSDDLREAVDLTNRDQ